MTELLPSGFIFIRWFDSTVAPATAVYDQEDIDAEKLIVLETVGWLVGETKEPYGGHYILAASKHGVTDWRGVQLIPKTNVIDSQRIRRENEPNSLDGDHM